MNKVWLFLVGTAALSQPSVDYHLTFSNAVHHEVKVEAVFRGITQPTLEAVMSVTSPGRYAIHSFANNVYEFSASDLEGRPLAVSRPSPYAWTVANPGSAVRLSYTVFGDQIDGTYSSIDETHAHLNLPAVLLWARGFENAPVRVTFLPPPHSGWRVATQMQLEPDGAMTAPNFAFLADSPLELSKHFLETWTEGGRTFRVAVHADVHEAEVRSYAKLVRSVVREEQNIFGAFPNYEGGTYTFLVDLSSNALNDGMEHRDSAVITGPSMLDASPGVLMGVISHEFFHSWNIRRIRPRSLQPFDFEHPSAPGELWFGEGFTSYYGPLVLARLGFLTVDDFAHEMSGAVNSVLTGPGRDLYSAVGMSRLAAFTDGAFFGAPTNLANTFISYYPYGAALALGIDLKIRQQFPGKSLDDWMRAMWREHPDIDRPYTLTDLQHTLAQVTDEDFAREIFERHIQGSEPLPYAEWLAPAGFLLRKVHSGKPWIGELSFDTSGPGVKFGSTTLRGTPLYDAGLDRGDELLSCDRKEVNNPQDVNVCLARHAPGSDLSLKVNKRTGKSTVTVKVLEDPAVEIVPFERAGRPLTPQIKLFRGTWLASQTP